MTTDQLRRWERVKDAIFSAARTCQRETQPGPDQEAGLHLLNEAFLAFQRAIQNEGRCGFALAKAYQ